MAACTSPLLAYRLDDGSISFRARRGEGVALTLPCGQCMSCRLERSRQWAVRCVHEARMHDRNCFITLTYDDAHLPDNNQLRYADFQLFMKRLRKRFGSVRFYACGEYGSKNGRPHYHACLFGIDFADRVPFRKGGSGFMSYESSALSSLWRFGAAWVGDMSFESAAYCSRYITTKLLGDAAKNAPKYVNVVTGEVFERVPEFTRMSLKPGIGRPFYDKFYTDMFPHDRVVVRGKVCKPPRYYTRILAKADPLLWEELSFRRMSLVVPGEQSEERLIARDVCVRANLSRFNRDL